MPSNIRNLMAEPSCDSPVAPGMASERPVEGYFAKQSTLPLSALVLPENEDYIVVSTRASVFINGDNQNQPQRLSDSEMFEAQNLATGRRAWSTGTYNPLGFLENDDDAIQIISKKPIIAISLENQRNRQLTSNSKGTLVKDPAKLSGDTVAPLLLPEHEDILVVSTKPTISITGDKLTTSDPLGACEAVMPEARDWANLSRETCSMAVSTPNDDVPGVAMQPIISISSDMPTHTPAASHSIFEAQDLEKYSSDNVFPLHLPENELVEGPSTRPISSVDRDAPADPPVGPQCTMFEAQHRSKQSHHNVSPLTLPENEDIQIVSKKPAIPIHRRRPRQRQSRLESTHNHLMASQIVLLLSIPLLLLLLLNKRQQRKESHDNHNHTQQRATDTTTISVKQSTPLSSQGTEIHVSTRPQTASPDPIPEKKIAGNHSIDDSHNHSHGLSWQQPQSSIHGPPESSYQPCTLQFESNRISSTVFSTPHLQEINDGIHYQPPSSQVAGAIRSLQDVVQEKGIDSALAQQMTIALHSSQQLVLAQEQVKLQAMFLETHQKLILQQQQQAPSSYDPNWKDKLRDRRDKCWNAACRLIWDVGVAHLLVKFVKPLLPFLIANRQEGYMSSTTQILHVLVNSICDCSSPPSTLDSTSTLSWLFYASFSTEIFSSIWSWDSYNILGQGACYGHCFLSLGIVSMIALVAHQLLRAFSFPFIFHHGINAFAISILLGGITPMDWISQIRPELLIMAMICVVGLLTNVEWKYRSRCRAMANSSPSTFRTLWDESIDTMDTLQFNVSMTRFIAMVILGSMLWLQVMDDKKHFENSSSGAVAAVI